MTARARQPKHPSGPLVDFEFLWELLDQAPEYVFAVGPDGTLAYVNRYLRTQIGMRWADLAGRNVADIFPGEEGKRMQGSLARVCANGEPLLVTAPTTVAGRALQLETLLVPLFDEEGNVERIFGYSRDITARLETERELAENQRLVADVFENPLIGIVVVDNEMRIQLMSRGTIELLGLNATGGNTSGRLLTEILPPPLRERFSEFLDCTTKPAGPCESILPLRTTEGQIEKWGRFQFYRVDESHLVLTVTDVSEQKRFEHALLASEQRYRRLSEAALEGIVIHAQADVLDANQTMADMLGIPLAELIGARGLDFVAASSLDTVQRAIADESESPYEALLRRADGSTFWAEIRGRGYQYDGRKVRIIAVRDISERKRLEGDLLRAQKLESIGVLAGGIAHDFNNLLAGIMGHLSLLRNQLPAGTGSESRLQIIEDAARRARTLTRRLLTFARGSNPIRSALPVEHFVKRALALSLTGSNVRSDLRVSPQLPAVWVDGDQIVQALTNLILNAREAMPDGGTITVECEQLTEVEQFPSDLHGDVYVRIRVRDVGVGMSEEIAARAFDPFFSTKPRGTGLGLATAYSILRSHEGHISLYSPQEGGTIAELWLPVASSEATPQIEDSEIDSGEYGIFRGRALVMDDDPTVRQLLAEMLNHLGFECEVSAHGDECTQLYREALENGARFDLVILDLTVAGGKGGQETMELLRQVDPGVCGVVSSGYSHVPVMSDFEAFGFSAILTKPYSLKELRAAVRVALKRMPR